MLRMKKGIKEILKERILILDGAMGTMIQQYDFSEEDFRGERFKDFPASLKGNNDLLSLTQPKAIKEIHKKYLEAGADIIETNTFSTTSIAMADYKMEDLVYEMNFESAKIAKEVANEFTEKEKSKKFTISGFVRNEIDGEILIGAGVILQNLFQGTITNEYGFYSLTLPEGKYILNYSYIGFEDKFIELNLNSDKNISKNLSPSL